MEVHVNDVEHYQQRGNWDCGVSCVIMTLAPDVRKRFLADLDAVCADEGFGTSTWTIDLAYLLRRLGKRRIKYATTTIGVDPGYKKERFYSAILDKDSERVNRRFKEAEFPVEERQATLDEVVDHLSYHEHYCIVLIDANRLRGDFSRSSACCWASKTPFQGHYILLIGWDRDTRDFFYHNPSSRPGTDPSRLSFDRFEDARSSYGTDFDIIFISKDQD